VRMIDERVGGSRCPFSPRTDCSGLCNDAISPNLAMLELREERVQREDSSEEDLLQLLSLSSELSNVNEEEMR
jgi:hypothetical protein